ADADVAAAAGENGGVDANQLATKVHQGAAGITRVDGRIRLDEILVAVRIDSRAGQAADDAGGDGMLEAERVADGQHKVTHFDFGGIAERDLHQAGAFRFDLQHGDVGGLIAADDFGFQVTAVLQRYGDFARVLDHARVG